MDNKSNGKNIVSNMVKKKVVGFIRNKIMLFLLGGCGSTFFLLAPAIPILVVLLVVLGIFSNSSSGSISGSVNSGVSNNGECGFTISKTSLSKSEFKSKIQKYANTYGQWQIFVDYADDYYDYAVAKGINPELIVTVAGKECGGNPCSKGNYWGWGCPNGASQCEELSGFMVGARHVIDSLSKSDTIYNWFYIHHYSWIGDYWYNPGSSGSGGCYYAPHIYPDGTMPERVKRACASGNECVGSSCQPTIPEEDQAAYSNYLIKVMLQVRKSVFGLDADEGVACTNDSSSNSGSGSSSSSDFVESYVQWMINTTADDSVGYDQGTRNLNPNVDCSSFVWYGLVKGASVKASDVGGYAFATGSMETILTNIGFKKYTYTSQKDLKRGDILWVHSDAKQHTEVYVGDGKNVGAHDNYDGRDGDSSGREVNVSNSYNDSFGWMAYFRYEGNK